MEPQITAQLVTGHPWRSGTLPGRKKGGGGVQTSPGKPPTHGVQTHPRDDTALQEARGNIDKIQTIVAQLLKSAAGHPDQIDALNGLQQTLQSARTGPHPEMITAAARNVKEQCLTIRAELGKRLDEARGNIDKVLTVVGQLRKSAKGQTELIETLNGLEQTLQTARTGTDSVVVITAARNARDQCNSIMAALKERTGTQQPQTNPPPPTSVRTPAIDNTALQEARGNLDNVLTAVAQLQKSATGHPDLIDSLQQLERTLQTARSGTDAEAIATAARNAKGQCNSIFADLRGRSSTQPPPTTSHKPPGSELSGPPLGGTRPPSQSTTREVISTEKPSGRGTAPSGAPQEVKAKVESLKILSPSPQEREALQTLATGRPGVAKGIADALAELDAQAALARTEATRLGVPEGLSLSALEAQRDNARRAANEAEQAMSHAQARNLHNTNWKQYEPIQNRKNEARAEYERLEQQYQAAKKAQEAADKARAAQARLLNAVRFGPLSGAAPRTLDDRVALPIIAQFKDYPELASAALDVAMTAEHPEVIARGLAVLGPLERKGFVKSDGTYKFPEDARKMARNALELGGRLGGDYFERMQAYYRTPPAPDPNHIVGDGYIKSDEKALAYTRDIATNLVGNNGEVNFNAPGLQSVLDKLKFHPDSLQYPQHALIDSVEGMRRKFTNPSSGNPYQAELSRVRTPTTASGKALVQQTLGLGGRLPTTVDAKRAVISAMITPFAQGQVGSCFATGPCLKKPTTDTLAVMKDLSRLVETGKLNRDGRPDLPGVLTLPPNENALVRSWEYTIATLGAREANSEEKHRFETALFGGFTDQTGVGKSVEALREQFEPDWESKQDRIKQAVGEAFTFTYDPTAKRDSTSDGVSGSGAFVMMYRSGTGEETPLTTITAFKTALKQVVSKALGTDRNPTMRGKVDTLIDSADFTASISAVYKKKQPDGAPWKLPGGGKEKDPTKVLFGGSPELKPLFTKGDVPPGTNRVGELLANTVKTLGSSRETFVTVGVKGVHTMNFLPNHPSLQALKGDVDRNLTDRVLTPSKMIAETPPEQERAQFLYEKALEALVDDENVLKSARLRKPGQPLKPLQLRNYILTQTGGRIKEDQIDTFLLKELNYPEFVLADTNWGDARGHTLLVVAPDPSSPTGELRLWKKDAFTGKMTREDDKWVNNDWEHLG
jgi:hypothetical protein